MPSVNQIHIACCITSHGFGHAARTVAIMEALSQIKNVYFHIFTTVPEWFFKESLQAPFLYYPYELDMGLVQSSSLKEDLPATLEKLNDFYPVKKQLLHQLVAHMNKCQLVLCDVAPIGIVAAEEAGIPSVLIENFTWDWIYRRYARIEKKFTFFAEYLKNIYNSANYHIQTEPVCKKNNCSQTTLPVSRRLIKPSGIIRQQLQTNNKTVVLITMGGIGWDHLATDILLKKHDYVFIIPGADKKQTYRENLRLLPQNSGYYHPDLVAASDIVIGKVGYSTLAEVYNATTTWGYINRPGFPETTPLSNFIKAQMTAMEIYENEFMSGEWTNKLDLLNKLANKGKGKIRELNGSEQAAIFLSSILGR